MVTLNLAVKSFADVVKCDDGHTIEKRSTLVRTNMEACFTIQTLNCALVAYGSFPPPRSEFAPQIRMELKEQNKKITLKVKKQPKEIWIL